MIASYRRVLWASASPTLSAFLREMEGLLHQRGEALGGRVTAGGRSATAEVADYLMLQAINRYEPVAGHLAAAGAIHPEDLYCFAAALAGELATYTLPSKRPSPLERYRHDNLRTTFDPLFNAVRSVLSAVLEQNAVSIRSRSRGSASASVSSPTSHFTTPRSSSWLRAPTCPSRNSGGHSCRRSRWVRSSASRILVNLGLPGIALQALPSPPRQVALPLGLPVL
jgi:type VI secretion system protein ImpJ